MTTIFQNRSHAGQLLAKKLAKYASHENAIVLALPRGGIPVAFEISKNLHLHLDIFLVRKLGVPGHPELAMGAIATGGVRVLNNEVIESLGISQLTIDSVAAKELVELSRRESEYRGNDPSPLLEGKTVILVDDGIATGSTMFAAIHSIKQQKPGKIVVAIPIAARSSLRYLNSLADEVVCLTSPEHFFAVGQAYREFDQLSDKEVTDLLSSAAASAVLA